MPNTLPFTNAGDVKSKLYDGVLKTFNSKVNRKFSAPSDGRILQLHYKYLFMILAGTFSAIWGGYFFKESLHCVSEFNASPIKRNDIMELCLSYLYVTVDGARNYLIYYKWMHWAFLFAACLSYLPRKFSKMAEDNSVKEQYEYVVNSVHDMNVNLENTCTDAARLFLKNLNNHRGLFSKYCLNVASCLVIDIAILLLFDKLLQNRFIGLGINAFPYEKDWQNMTDHLSVTFPLFAKCEVTEVMQLVNKRTENFGCFLVANEIYEKSFFILWFYLYGIIILTALYLVCLALFCIPALRLYFLTPVKPVIFKGNVKELTMKATEDFQLDDWFLYYKLSEHFTAPGNIKILELLQDEKFVDSVMQPALERLRSSEKPVKYSPKKCTIVD